MFGFVSVVEPTDEFEFDELIVAGVDDDKRFDKNE